MTAGSAGRIIAAPLLLMSATVGRSEPPTLATANPPQSAEQLIANGRRFARLDRVQACREQAAASDDIIVCAPAPVEALPVPEVYGPAYASTDGRAVDPRGVPCGASISNQCYEGLDLVAMASATVGVLLMAIDPDRNLGEGTRIPERFRGANR